MLHVSQLKWSTPRTREISILKGIFSRAGEEWTCAQCSWFGRRLRRDRVINTAGVIIKLASE